MKGSKIKSKISHLFKGKSNKLNKYHTFDQAASVNVSTNPKNIESISSPRGNKKSHKKPKTNLNVIDTKIKNLGEFPVLPSPITDNNESAKLTAEEFAKAVGIKILHRTDEEEDEECDCEYCRSAFNNNGNLNTTGTFDHFHEDNNGTIQQIPNISLNQHSINNASFASSNSLTSINENINIPPFPTYNLNFTNDKMNKFSSNSSINTSNSNHSIVNSKTIGTPGYNCHCNRKNSISKVIDMSLFIPPTEEEIRNRVHSSSMSINSTPETSSIPVYASNDKIMGGSLDRNRKLSNVTPITNFGSPIAKRERSISTSIASSSRNGNINNINGVKMMPNEYRTSPIVRDTSIGYPSRMQYHQRRNSGTELANANVNANANANANINPSSPNKRPYPSSLTSSSSSTTLSSSLSLTHISQPPLAQIPSSQSSSQSSTHSTIPFPSLQNNPYNNIQSVSSFPSLPAIRNSPPKQEFVTSPLNSIKSPVSTSSITPVKPHSNLKITRSVTISEGTRCAEIDIHPMEPDEVKVYTKGRFTITCEHSRRPSVHSFQVN